MREGLIPAVLGTAVTTAGTIMRFMDMRKKGFRRRDTMVAVGAGLVGFGLAHIVLGTIDLIRTKT